MILALLETMLNMLSRNKRITKKGGRIRKYG